MNQEQLEAKVKSQATLIAAYKDKDEAHTKLVAKLDAEIAELKSKLSK